jgi:alkanesulfonate monooxygenase SsuD/methylene tetrahydromethanopterin reductase-like flavin-dependent oxidoreductase (luciferase family)
MVIAETDTEALAVARRAYKAWYANFMALWWKYNQKPLNVNYPPEIETPIEIGTAVVGSPQTVLDALRPQLAESGSNYLVCRFAFGDLSLNESLRSLDLFKRHVAPALKQGIPVAAQ